MNKYTLAASLIPPNATVLDVGARDRVLATYLPPATTYLSADITPGHDYNWDLEQPIPAADRAFQILIALDVLEHLDHLHQAFSELLRITRQALIISLPNLSSLKERVHYLRTGRPSSAKYRLQEQPAADRHRWLLHHDDVIQFIFANTPGQSARCYYLHDRYTPLRLALPLPDTLRAHTMLFHIQKEAP